MKLIKRYILILLLLIVVDFGNKCVTAYNIALEKRLCQQEFDNSLEQNQCYYENKEFIINYYK